MYLHNQLNPTDSSKTSTMTTAVTNNDNEDSLARWSISDLQYNY